MSIKGTTLLLIRVLAKTSPDGNAKVAYVLSVSDGYGVVCNLDRSVSDGLDGGDEFRRREVSIYGMRCAQ